MSPRVRLSTTLFGVVAWLVVAGVDPGANARAVQAPTLVPFTVKTDVQPDCTFDSQSITPDKLQLDAVANGTAAKIATSIAITCTADPSSAPLMIGAGGGGNAQSDSPLRAMSNGTDALRYRLTLADGAELPNYSGSGTAGLVQPQTTAGSGDGFHYNVELDVRVDGTTPEIASMKDYTDTVTLTVTP
jgi:spore coat protein U-like protein